MGRATRMHSLSDMRPDCLLGSLSNARWPGSQAKEGRPQVEIANSEVLSYLLIPENLVRWRAQEDELATLIPGQLYSSGSESVTKMRLK
jgi:hypothetical protein